MSAESFPVPSEPVARRDGAAGFEWGARPALLVGGARGWPAFERWSLDFFAARGRDVPVILECGNVMQRTTRYQRTTLASYVEAIQGGDGGGDEGAYLSVFELFAVMPELSADVGFEGWLPGRPKRFIRTWLGPAGTVTGLHADYPDNVLAQIRGRKLVHLIGPEDTGHVYPSRKYEYGIRMSEVDAKRFDADRWPRLARARVYRALLEPGDALYIPGGWWHHVASLDASISVNCFAVSWPRFVHRESRELVRAMLHRLGLLGRDGCTCHGLVDGRRVSRESLARQALEGDG